MEKLNSFFKSKLALSLSAVVVIVFFTISLVRAGTEIGDDINTAGQLIAGGVAYLNGGINVNNGNFRVATDGAVNINNGTFTVTNEGMVGLGTSNPTDLLDIAGNLHFKGYTYPGVELGQDVEALDIRKDGDGANHVYLYNNSIDSFSGTSTYKFKITTSGPSYVNGAVDSNFGIGTITPTAKFMVVGGGSDNSHYTQKIVNSNGNTIFYARSDGKIAIGKEPVAGQILRSLTIEDLSGNAGMSIIGTSYANLDLQGTDHAIAVIKGGTNAQTNYETNSSTNTWAVGSLDGTGFDIWNNSPGYPAAVGSKLFISPSTGYIGLGGVSVPGQQLEVNGGMRLNTATAKPTCTDATNRGTFWVTQGGTGVADSVEVCAKDASNAYAWRTIY